MGSSPIWRASKIKGLRENRKPFFLFRATILIKLGVVGQNWDKSCWNVSMIP